MTVAEALVVVAHLGQGGTDHTVGTVEHDMLIEACAVLADCFTQLRDAHERPTLVIDAKAYRRYIKKIIRDINEELDTGS